MKRVHTTVGFAALLAIGALGVGLAGGAAQAMAGGGGEKGQHGGRHAMRAMLGAGAGVGAKGERGERLRERLNLSEEQRTVIRETLKSHREEFRAACKPVREARRELRAAVGAEAIDEGSIKAKSAALGEAIAHASLLVAKVKAEVVEKANFTAEQKDVLREVKAKIQEAVGRAMDGQRGGRGQRAR